LIKEGRQCRPQCRRCQAAGEITGAWKSRASEHAHGEYQHIVHEQQHEHVQDLVAHGEHQDAPVQNDAGKRQYRVGERMLAEQAAFRHVHDESQQPGGCEADLARLLNAPVEHDQCYEIRLDYKPPARPR